MAATLYDKGESPIHWRSFPRLIKRVDGLPVKLEWSDRGEQWNGGYVTLYRIGGERVLSSAFTGPPADANQRFEADCQALLFAGIDPEDIRLCLSQFP